LADDLEQPLLLRCMQWGRRDRLHDVLVADREAVFPVVRHLADEALVGNDPQTINVAPAVDGLGPRLLRTHIVRRADRHAGAGQTLGAARSRDGGVRYYTEA